MGDPELAFLLYARNQLCKLEQNILLYLYEHGKFLREAKVHLSQNLSFHLLACIALDCPYYIVNMQARSLESL